METIYNVEKYVRKCLESLKNQTMREIEVICIDDGSTDASGEIADEYESCEFPIVHVIHTENQGLSAARNRGLDEANASWIMFVDSDDWVDEKFCEIPFKTSQKYRAEMVIFDNYQSTETGVIKRSKRRSTKKGLIDNETAIDIARETAWNRLYKKDLFRNIRYPERYVYEDIGTTHELVYKASRIVSINDKLYYYRYRKGSICHSVSSDSDRLTMGKKRYQELIQFRYPEWKAEALLCADALRSYGRAKKGSDLHREAGSILRKISRTPVNLSKKEKIMMYIWNMNENVYRALYKMFIRQQMNN